MAFDVGGDLRMGSAADAYIAAHVRVAAARERVVGT